MKQLLSTRASRIICYVLIFALIMPSFMLALTASPAEAQIPTLAVGVIDFRNESGVQGEMLSRLATDAVALELAKQPTFDIFPRSQIADVMKRAGMQPPLNKIQLTKLGQELVADAMVEGAIRDVQIRGTGGNRKAAVTLVVRMLDQASGEVINGGIQTGYSNPRVGYSGDDDTLITEAIHNAAFLVVKTMSEYIIPEATVQNSVGTNQVMLNKGSRDGIKRGMRMIVKRDKEIIGYLQVTSVTPLDATASVVRAMRGVKAEDKATAIFDMPAVSEVRPDPSEGSMGAPPVKKSASKMGKGKNLLLGLLALGGLIALINGGSGNENPGSASAAMTTSGVQVKWNPSNLWGGKNVIEAHVWRDDVATPILVAPWRSGQAIDNLVARTTNYNTANPETREQVAGTTTVPAVTYGTSYTYRVSALYSIASQSNTDALSYFETDLAMAGRVTPIRPIVPADDFLVPSAGDPVDHTDPNFKFQWVGRKGADRYIIQVSTSPSFPENAQWSNYDRPISWDPNALDPTMTWTASDTLRNYLSNAISTAPDDVNIWWRVGCANSQDTSFKGGVSSYQFSQPSVFILPKKPVGPGGS